MFVYTFESEMINATSVMIMLVEHVASKNRNSPHFLTYRFSMNIFFNKKKKRVLILNDFATRKKSFIFKNRR